jgi:hypothetical protein
MDSETRKWMRLHDLIDDDNWDQIVYIYRVGANGQKITPYVAKWNMHAGLLDSIRDEFGTGEYHLMIRDGKTMVFTGTIGVARPLRR